MINRIFKTSLVTFALFLLGCSALSGSTPPEVTVVNLEFTDVSLFETSLRVKVRYDNEMNKPLVIHGSTHQLTLNGIDVGKARSKEDLTIARLDSAEQELVFRIDNLAVLSRIRRLIESESFRYKILSTVYTPSGLGDVGITSSKQGEYRLSDFGLENSI